MKHSFLKNLVTGLAFGAAFCSFASLASAQDPLRYEVMQHHSADQPAQMRIIANESLKNVNVTITNCAPQVVQRAFPSMKKGETQTISWNQNPGKYSCGIAISGDLNMGGSVSVRNTHDFVCGASTPLSLLVDLNEIKELTPSTNHVVLHGSRAFNRASITVTAEDGTTIDTVDKSVGAAKDYTLNWKPSSKKPVLLEIKVTDETSGAWASNTIMSFMIPHTDIVFDTNKFNIRKDQEGFLEEPLEIILDKVRRFDRVAVSLYITGFTDTVGSDASNIKLSLNRAKSIAAWFRKHGLSIPTYYRGAGERALAVQTPDNTPEEKNRRAVYILSNNPPVDGLGSWTQLK